MGNVTIKMLAKELNLSTAAVSKALRDSHEISNTTKQRVLELARVLNYVPHPYAGSLRKKESKTIAVVIPEVADGFFALAINGIESVALQKGYHALIYLTHENFEREKTILKDLERGRVDGVLMSVTNKTNTYTHIQELNKVIPLVFFDRVCDEIDTAKVTTNDYESAYQATRHLIEAGCRRIALFAISDSLSISSKRMEGYKQALLDFNIDVDADLILNYCDDAKENLRLVTEMLNNNQRPDGILATVEKMTIEIYQVCQELNISMPDDLKVICFSNEPTAAILTPSLTTVTQPAFEMGKRAATILFKALEKKYTVLNEESVVIPSSLIVRKSTLLSKAS
jgi:LacI family transcriptional regulator